MNVLGTFKNEFPISRLVALTHLLLDFDGVMTDGKVLVGPNGEEWASCSRRDGLGIALLQQAGIKVTVITYEMGGPAVARCKKLGIDCISTKDKLAVIQLMFGHNNEQIAYMGDDLMDLLAMRSCAFKITVADGHPELKVIADYITHAKGGDHAVREVCDLLLAFRR